MRVFQAGFDYIDANCTEKVQLLIKILKNMIAATENSFSVAASFTI